MNSLRSISKVLLGFMLAAGLVGYAYHYFSFKTVHPEEDSALLEMLFLMRNIEAYRNDHHRFPSSVDEVKKGTLSKYDYLLLKDPSSGEDLAILVNRNPVNGVYNIAFSDSDYVRISRSEIEAFRKNPLAYRPKQKV